MPSIRRASPNAYVMATGLRSHKSTKELQEGFAHRYPKLILQVVPGEIVAGAEHAHLVAHQTLTAIEHHSLYARHAPIDLLIRLTCKRQIDQALKTSEIMTRTGRFAIIAIGSRDDLANLKQRLTHEGTMDDAILELTESKRKSLIKLHKISRKEIAATVSFRDALPWILAERSATLGV